METLRSYFVISLDFELAWGFHDKDIQKTGYINNVKGARESVLKTLKLFEKHQIHATWAIVGALFCRSKTELENLVNKELTYTESGHRLKDYLEEKIGLDEEDDPLHFAPTLIEKISSSKDQEIGSHTFTHFYVMDETNDPNALEKELIGMAVVCPEAESMVFPRNQSMRPAVEVLRKRGYTSYRGLQENALWKYLVPLKKENKILSKIRRLIRLSEVYLPLYGVFSYPIESAIEEGICNFRASAMFKPYFPKLAFLERLKINNIKRGMKIAAQKGHVYHLWWHPHNTGINYDLNFKQLDDICAYYNELAKKHKMISVSMKELASILREGAVSD